MKKVLFTTLTLAGLSMGTASAQNCCTTEKEECEPKVCCVTTSECCEDDAATYTPQKSKQNKKRANKKAIARKEIVATRKN